MAKNESYFQLACVVVQLFAHHICTVPSSDSLLLAVPSEPDCIPRDMVSVHSVLYNALTLNVFSITLIL